MSSLTSRSLCSKCPARTWHLAAVLYRRYNLLWDRSTRLNCETNLPIPQTRGYLSACWKQRKSPSSRRRTGRSVKVRNIRPRRSPTKPRKFPKYRLRFSLFNIVVLVKNSVCSAFEHFLYIPAGFGATFNIVTSHHRLGDRNSLETKHKDDR